MIEDQKQANERHRQAMAEMPKVHTGCLSCGPVEEIAPMDLLIGVGFGVAQVQRDDEVVFDENNDPDVFHYLFEFEEMAKTDPDHKWTVLLHAPLRSRVYQRQAEGKWVLIESGNGFA